MKAIKYARYGQEDVIEVVDVEVREPTENEVMIRVVATTISPYDIAYRTGNPFALRLAAGMTKPNSIPGVTFSGIVKKIGNNVTKYQVDDHVSGTTAPKNGAHASYIYVDENGAMAKKAPSVTHGEAASLGDGAITALPFLRDHGKIKPGEHLLIYGASGAIGTYSIQLAKHYGATVTAVCSGKNEALVRSLGADFFIDYEKEYFTRQLSAYDVIFDTVGKISYQSSRQSLKQNGRYLTTVPTLPTLLHMVKSKMLSKGHLVIFAATGIRKGTEKTKDFIYLKELVAQGKLKSIIDRTYSFEEIKDAHKYVEAGHKVGNVVVMMDDVEK